MNEEFFAAPRTTSKVPELSLWIDSAHAQMFPYRSEKMMANKLAKAAAIGAELTNP